MKHPAFKYIKYVVFLGIGVLLLWLVYRNQDLSQTWKALRSANYLWVSLSVAVILLSHVSRAQRWRMLITPIGNTPRLTTSIGAVLIGYLANLAFPRLGEVTKCGIINRYERIPVDKLIGTMVTERVLDLIMLLILTVVILAVEFERFGDFFATQIATPLGDKIMENQWVLVVLAALTIGLMVFLVISYRKRTGPTMKMRGFLVGIWQGIRSITQVRNIGMLLFHSVFIWACYYLATWLCFFALSSTESLGASAALAVLVFGSFGMVAPVQGGLGAFHVMAISTLIAYNITSDSAGDFAALIHGSQMLVVIIAGSLALIVLPFLNRKQRHARATQIEPQDPS